MTLVVNIIFSIIGGLGIFIYGMNQMSKNIQDLAGNKLRKVINKITGNRFSALTAGVIITAILQSSSVTTVMVVGFIDATLMNLNQALGVILGSNIGSTFTGWLLVLKIGKFGLPITGFGALLTIFTKKKSLRKKAHLLMGFGMIFLGLEIMKNGISPLKEMPEFILLFQKFNADSYSGIILSAITGAFITAIVQSSAVTVGITMALATQGLIDINSAVALVLGQNIGTTITAFLASLGAGTTAKKAAYSHILIKVTGVIIVIPLFHQYIKLVSFIDRGTDITTFIAFAHTLFNVINSFLLLPFIPLISKLWNFIIKEKDNKDFSNSSDAKLFDTPFIILEKSNMEIQLMAEEFQTVLDNFVFLIKNDKELDENKRSIIINKIINTEQLLDDMNLKIRNRLMSLLKHSNSNNVLFEVKYLIEVSDQYESFGDYGADLVKLYLKAKNNNIKVSKKKKIANIHKSVSESFSNLTSILKNKDFKIIKNLKTNCINLNEMLMNDVEIADKSISTAIYSDVLTRYRRINRHILYVLEATEKFYNE